MMHVSRATRNSLRKFLSFSGRTSRGEFWTFVPFGFALCVLAYLAAAIFDTSLSARLMVVALIATPLIAAWWRRIQDTGSHGSHAVTPMFALFATVMFGATALYLQGEGSTVNGEWAMHSQTGLILGALIIVFTHIFAGAWIALFLCLAAFALFAIRFSFALSIALLPSTPGPNRYGPNPHEVPQ